MFLHRHCLLWLRFWNENWLFFGVFRRVATAASWPAADGPFAEPIDRWRRDRHAMLIEPFGNLAISPMLAAQGENGFAVRFQFTAGPALLFVLSL